MRYSFGLLFSTGSLLATTLLFTRWVAAGGMPAQLILLSTTLGAGAVLAAKAGTIKQSYNSLRQDFAFYAIAGGVSYAFPNFIILGSVKHIGAGFAATLHTFVPGITYAVALLSGLDRFSLVRLVGLLVGFLGAFFSVVSHLGLIEPSQIHWALIALLAPISIAIGNNIRSRFWPEGVSLTIAAPALLTFAGLETAIAAMLFSQPVEIPSHSFEYLLAASVLSALYYFHYFKLQLSAGPVYLSQIGYIAAAIAVPAGAIIFSETLSRSIVIGLVLVFVGIILVRPYNIQASLAK